MRILIAMSLVLAGNIGSTLAQTGSVKPAAGAVQAGKTEDPMAECMRLWDKGTHMTKQEWTVTCRRIQSRLENLKVDNMDVMGTGVRRKAGTGKQSSVDSPSRTK